LAISIAAVVATIREMPMAISDLKKVAIGLMIGLSTIS